MAGLKLEGFLGIAPRYSERLLAPMAAVTAQNTKLLNGEIRGFRELFVKRNLSGFASTVRRVMRVPNPTSQVVDPNIQFLAKFEGADAATAYTEVSQNALVGTFSNDAQLDTSTFNFGVASLQMDGTGDLVTFPNVAALELGSSDFTVEFFFRINAVLTNPEQRHVISHYGTSGNRPWAFTLRADGFSDNRITTYVEGGAETFTLNNTTLMANVWYHACIVRQGDDYRVGINGFREFTNLGVLSGAMQTSDEVLRIGTNPNSIGSDFDGRVDDVRISNSAVYDLAGSSTYTVPTVDFTGTVPSGGDSYIAFDSRDVSIVKSPLINDAFDRYFWAGDGEPKMNTGDRIKNGDPEYLLGIPIPTVAPDVVPPVGSDETRAYVYTFESEFGEEGPPSPPTLATGDAGAWELSNLQTAVPDASQRSVLFKNIYRTVPGQVSSSFFFVAKIAIGASTYQDNETNEDVASSPLLESTAWIEPPSDMEGFVVMPNGYLVGWAGRRLLFSEPYRPHAWPAAFELATEFDIVGLGVFGSTLVIATESQPYFGQGVSPLSFTTVKLDAVEPCLSRRSIVSTLAGVYYASINGLVAATGSGIQVITRDVVTKEEWAAFSPSTIYASQLGLQYIAFSDANTGFIYDPQEPRSKLITLDGFTNVEGIETDPYTGNVYLLTNDNYAEWDPENAARITWRWKGKMNHFPKPLNFGAVRVHFESGNAGEAFPVETILRPYNEALFTAINALPAGNQRLNTLNGVTLGGTPAQQIGLVTAPEAEIRQSLGGSLLYDLNYLAQVVQSVRFIAYARRDQATITVIDTVLTTEKIIRLPTGFKADLWQFEMIGNTTVYSVQIAETPNQLAGI